VPHIRHSLGKVSNLSPNPSPTSKLGLLKPCPNPELYYNPAQTPAYVKSLPKPETCQTLPRLKTRPTPCPTPGLCLNPALYQKTCPNPEIYQEPDKNPGVCHNPAQILISVKTLPKPQTLKNNLDPATNPAKTPAPCCAKPRPASPHLIISLRAEECLDHQISHISTSNGTTHTTVFS
jgi:hypothetical protein